MVQCNWEWGREFRCPLSALRHPFQVYKYMSFSTLLISLYLCYRLKNAAVSISTKLHITTCWQEITVLDKEIIYFSSTGSSKISHHNIAGPKLRIRSATRRLGRSFNRLRPGYAILHHWIVLSALLRVIALAARQHQAITWTDVGSLSIGSSRTYVNEI